MRRPAAPAALLAIALACGCESEVASRAPAVKLGVDGGGKAELEAQLAGAPPDLGSGKPQTVRIAVTVPPDHHGYLDRGDKGFLVPFTFSVPALAEQGGRITVTAAPAGSRDERAAATVLRGTGTFELRLEPGSGLPAARSGAHAAVRYQICNDITRVCYPPEVLEVPLAAR